VGNGSSRQWQQDAALFIEGVADRARAVLHPRAIEGRCGSPLRRLVIEVDQVCVCPGSEERLAYVADGSLDAPFLIAAGHIDGPWLEPMVRGEPQKLAVESNRITMALEDGALEIVVEQNTRRAAELGECLDMAAHEERHGRAKIEAEKEPSRVAEHHDERPEGASGSADLQLAEVRPVHLGLLAGQRVQPLKRLGGLLRTQTTNDPAQVVGTTRVAPLLDHREDPTGGQLRVLPQLLDDEGHGRVHHRRPRGDHLGVDARLSKHALNRGVMEAELRGDGANRPLFAVVEAHDLRLGLVGDHRHPRSRWRTLREPRRAASAPAMAGASAVTPRPSRQWRSAERTPAESRNRTDIELLSARGFRREQRCRRGPSLRHGVMRHFRRQYLVLTPSPISELSGGVQATGSELATVGHARALDRVTSLQSAANLAESLP
jgi:hypothetical protein